MPVMTEPRTESLTTVPLPQVPSCTCGKSLTFDSEVKSWRCFSCNPFDPNTPTCATQKCLRPLTRLGDPWNCWICLHCNTHPSKVSARKTEQPERKYIDQKLTAETVQDMIKKEMSGIGDMVRETMAEFNLKESEDPDYPPTRAEIITMTAPENINAKPETWLQKAKRLGVRTHNDGTGGMRKKVEIMADIKAKETEPSPEGDKKNAE